MRTTRHHGAITAFAVTAGLLLTACADSAEDDPQTAPESPVDSAAPDDDNTEDDDTTDDDSAADEPPNEESEFADEPASEAPLDLPEGDREVPPGAVPSDSWSLQAFDGFVAEADLISGIDEQLGGAADFDGFHEGTYCPDELPAEVDATSTCFVVGEEDTGDATLHVSSTWVWRVAAVNGDEIEVEVYALDQ